LIHAVCDSLIVLKFDAVEVGGETGFILYDIVKGKGKVVLLLK
jgi:hypothetical protein